MTKNNKDPLRMCVACRKMKPKSELIKISMTKSGAYSFHPQAEGRGAYVCSEKECVNKCLKKRLLNKAFKRSIPSTVYDNLGEHYEGIKQN
ncbi:MAG: RNase P modulator RnpM [Bacillota bacterium]